MFKKGDRVRCIDNEGSAGFAASLTVGTGTVSETTRMCCEATLRELHAAIGDILGLGDE